MYWLARTSRSGAAISTSTSGGLTGLRFAVSVNFGLKSEMDKGHFDRFALQTYLNELAPNFSKGILTKSAPT